MGYNIEMKIDSQKVQTIEQGHFLGRRGGAAPRNPIFDNSPTAAYRPINVCVPTVPYSDFCYCCRRGFMKAVNTSGDECGGGVFADCEKIFKKILFRALSFDSAPRIRR